ncbi:MAG: hypothetical protein JWM71_239, partial [Solirubrobacteraceae bacterium]|nr:hypothetical protein [Solirubrobacteraceae bacterium]
MIPRSLTGRVALGTLVVVAIALSAGGLAIVTVTDRDDARAFDAALRRTAATLTPPVAGAL